MLYLQAQPRVQLGSFSPTKETATGETLQAAGVCIIPFALTSLHGSASDAKRSVLVEQRANGHFSGGPARAWDSTFLLARRRLVGVSRRSLTTQSSWHPLVQHEQDCQRQT